MREAEHERGLWYCLSVAGSGCLEGRTKSELARGWSLDLEALTPCWEQDKIQWTLMGQAGILFKCRFIFLVFYLEKSSDSSLEDRIQTKDQLGYFKHISIVQGRAAGAEGIEEGES